jgi:hypothetical protein
MTRPTLSKLPLPNGADLRQYAWSAVGGDPCDRLGLKHGGSPYRFDVYGLRKIDTHGAALRGDLAHFTKIAEQFSSPSTRNKWTRSQRVTRWKDGKARPLDLPPEGKRLFAHFREHQLHAVVSDNGGLLPTIVGFRTLKEFPIYGERVARRKAKVGLPAVDDAKLTDEEARQEGKRRKRQRRRRKAKDGYTIQDVFAATVYWFLDEAGQFVVVVDLQDAFGRLPHRAIHEALHEQGLCRADRKEILDLVRINSVERDGKPVKTRKDEGIEQGNPLSPLIFNLVMDLAFRRLHGDGSLLRAASYGDDLVLVAATEAEAEALFERLFKIMTNLGFTNIRPLGGTDPKASKIYNTAVNPVPLIKTFLVSPSEVRLTAKAEAKVVVDFLKQVAPAERSLTKLRKVCPYKVVSKSFLEEVYDGLPGTKSSPNPERKLKAGRAAGSQSAPHTDLPPVRVEATASTSSGVEASASTPMGAEASVSTTMEDGEVYSSFASRGNAPEAGPGQRVAEGVSPMLIPSLSVSHTAGLDLYDTAENRIFGTNSTPTRERLESTDQARGHRTRCLGDGGAGPRSPSVTQPVSAEHLTDLAAGRRVTTNSYRDHVLDLRGLSTLPAFRIPLAVAQCVRLASKHGTAKLLVDPSADWVLAADLLRKPRVPSWKPLKLEDAHGGLLVTIRKIGAPKPRRPKPTAPPAADLVLRRPRIDPECRLVVHVPATRDGSPVTFTAQVASLTDRDAIRSALAIVIEEVNPATVAVPNRRGLGGELVPDPSRPKVRHRLVPLAEAMAILTRWTWTVQGDWLLGTRREHRPQAHGAAQVTRADTGISVVPDAPI